MTEKKVKQEKLLVCEFITAGGLRDSRYSNANATLPDSLLKEGAMMRDALLRELSALNQYELISMHDVRLLPSRYASKSIAVDSSDFRKTFKKAIKQADYVWLIAPESESALLELTEICLEEESSAHGAIFLGCGYDATLVGTSKTLSSEALQEAGVYTLPVFAGEDLIEQDFFNQMLQLNVQKWVAKLEDSAGCEGIRLFENLHDLRDWLNDDQRYLHYFAQPYQAGIVASISAVCRDGVAWVLSCNEIVDVCDGGTFRLSGLVVNGKKSHWQRFETIARKIAKMLPDALGYMGIDVILDAENDKIYVIDINPRITTSYVGLAEATGHNPAKIILDCVLGANFKLPNLQKNVVEISLE